MGRDGEGGGFIYGSGRGEEEGFGGFEHLIEKEVFFVFCPILYLLVHVWIPSPPPFKVHVSAKTETNPKKGAGIGSPLSRLKSWGG